jgi:hypothetical protein
LLIQDTNKVSQKNTTLQRRTYKRNGSFGRLLLIGKAMNLFTGVYKALYNKKFWK